MKIWLDDIREAPVGWTHCYNVWQAISCLLTNTVTDASLDHDLGDYAKEGGDGTRVTDWMAENNIWPSETITIHSGNPVGSATMLRTIDRYGPYKIGYGKQRAK